MSKKTTGRSLLIGAALMVLLSLALAACGGGSSSSSSETAPAETEPSAGGENAGGQTASGGEKEQVSVAMELILTGVSFGQQQQEGAEAFAAEDGHVNLEVQGPPTAEPEVAQKQALDMLAKKPDAFGFAPFPPELWTRTAKTIWDQVGPNVLNFNERPASEPQDVSSSPVKTFVGNNDAEMASLMLEEAIKLGKLPSSSTGEVLLGQCAAQEAGVLAQRTAAFEEVAKKMLPKAKVVTFTSEVEPQANTEAWTTALNAHSNVILAAGTCDQDGESLAKIKKQGDAKFIAGAMEAPPATVEGVKSGDITVDVASSHWLEGYTTARMLTEAARGEELPEGFVEIGHWTFTSKNADELVELTTEPEKFAAERKEELFGGGMPTAVPILQAF